LVTLIPGLKRKLPGQQVLPTGDCWYPAGLPLQITVGSFTFIAFPFSSSCHLFRVCFRAIE